MKKSSETQSVPPLIPRVYVLLSVCIAHIGKQTPKSLFQPLLLLLLCVFY